jgi:hypothetical protein
MTCGTPEPINSSTFQRRQGIERKILLARNYGSKRNSRKATFIVHRG